MAETPLCPECGRSTWSPATCNGCAELQSAQDARSARTDRITLIAVAIAVGLGVAGAIMQTIVAALR